MKSKRHFIVERLNWHPYTVPGYRPSATAKLKKGAMARLPGAERVASFKDRAKAEADCARREEEMRHQCNPFACGGPLCYQTSLDEGRLRDWMLDVGLTPPGTDAKGGWRAWWDENHAAMSEIQRAKVWEALDLVRFFRVSESSSGVLFMVVGPYWKYSDEYYYTEPDGLTMHKAFRTREEAERERADLEEIGRDVRDMHPFQIHALCDWSAWSSLSQDEAIERVVALGLPPPTGSRSSIDWEEWWDTTEMDGRQSDAVWDMLDKIRFWEVIEIEAPE
jgi:hypothetical protein